MTLNALEHRDIAKVNRVLEWLVGFVAILTFVIRKRPQIDRVLEWSGLHRGRQVLGIVDYSVADVAVVRDDLAGVADVLAIMTTEAAREIEMPDVVRVSLPVGLHLRKEKSLKDALNFRDRTFDRILFLRVQVFVVGSIKLGQPSIDRAYGLRGGVVLATQNFNGLSLEIW